MRSKGQRLEDELKTFLQRSDETPLKPPLPSLLIIQHYLTLPISFTSILTCCTHQIVVEITVFKNLTLVAYRRCKNISDILRAQLTNSTDTSNSRPTPVPFGATTGIEHGRNQYTFPSTGETHHIKSHITCETFNVIFLIQCHLCNLQYIRETKRHLKDRFNEHRRPILNPAGNYIHTAVSEHFLTSNHSDNHMLLIPIEKLKNGRDSFRKAREAHLIHRTKGRTIRKLMGGGGAGEVQKKYSRTGKLNKKKLLHAN